MILGLANIGLVALLIVRKERLKDCESRQSFRCPRFTCPNSNLKSNLVCGSRPWICPPGTKTCTDKEKICIGYCKKDEKNCLD